MSENFKPAGQQRYEDYLAQQMADSDFRAIYEQEAAQKELWLQLINMLARLA
ncbi:MAG TPA: hypothetical protein VHP83_19960 [Aggregatilineaceae bacterium]|nr:hypothetical protein [Aggregatilineaceae bacterium]